MFSLYVQFIHTSRSACRLVSKTAAIGAIFFCHPWQNILLTVAPTFFAIFCTQWLGSSRHLAAGQLWNQRQACAASGDHLMTHSTLKSTRPLLVMTRTSLQPSSMLDITPIIAAMMPASMRMCGSPPSDFLPAVCTTTLFIVLCYD